MAVVAKWLTHRIVAPTFVGSIPIGRPKWEHSQVVRHRSAKPLFPGSNPGAPSSPGQVCGRGGMADTLS